MFNFRLLFFFWLTNLQPHFILRLVFGDHDFLSPTFKDPVQHQLTFTLKTMEVKMKLFFNIATVLCMFSFSEVAANQNVTKQVVPTIGENSQQEHIFKEVIAKDGAKVTIIAISLEHSIFSIKGENFKVCEALIFTSKSCNEVLSFPIYADKNGNITERLFVPAVLGEVAGICYIDILRGEDPIHITLPWGNIKNEIDSVRWLGY